MLELFDKLRFVALTHDLGKAFSRKNHDKATVALLKAVMPMDYMTSRSSN